MSIIFNRLIQHTEDLKEILNKRAFNSGETHPFPWENLVYTSAHVRRAHLDVVDARDTKKLYMMHLCVFPKVFDSAPIYGFDLIAGPQKVTGAFHDFSPTGNKDHPLVKWFYREVEDLEWSKPRQLPEWAKNIFSERMIAAGNINTPEELDKILTLSIKTLEYYLDNIYRFWPDETYEAKISKYNYTKEQNWYCQNQKKNPHTPKVMESLGFSKETVEKFIQECLFPEV